MCGSKPSAPNYTVAPPAPPPPAAPAQLEAANTSTDANRSNSQAIEAKKKGRNALKIDLQSATASGTGLNIPAG